MTMWLIPGGLILGALSPFRPDSSSPVQDSWLLPCENPTGPTSWNAQLVSWDNLIDPTGTLLIHREHLWYFCMRAHTLFLAIWVAEGLPLPGSASHTPLLSFLMTSTCGLFYILFIFSISSILIAQEIDKGTEGTGYKVFLLHCPNCWSIDMISCLCGPQETFLPI